METSIHYDLAQKQLGFRLREKVSTKFNVELKANGLFNTVTGQLDYRGTAKKCISTGARLKDESGSTPFTIGLGVVAISGQKEPVMTLSAKKKLPLLDGPNTILSAKLEADMDHHGTTTRRRGTFKLSHKALNFTKKQDLKLTAGVDLDWPLGAKQPKPTPLFQVHENNWGAHFRNNRWSLTYDL